MSKQKRDRTLERYQRLCGILLEGLKVYADPEFYHAIAVFGDRPCGDFADDMSRVKDSDYDRPMHGKLARRTISRAIKRYGDLKVITKE